MLIVCPQCGTSYRVTPESLGDTGRSVRCVSCHGVWFEQPHGPAAMGFAAEPIDPTQIRPPLDDVVAIGEADADLAGGALPSAAHVDGDWLPDAPDSTSGHSADAPSIVPGDDPARGGSQADAVKNVERAAAQVVKSRRPPRRQFSLSRHALPAVICVLALILVCLAAGRHQIVRSLPQTASLYARVGMPVNLRGLSFENIKTVREIDEGVPMLVVEGEIVGTTGRHAEVPRLRFAVTDAGGKEIYAWTARPSRSLLPPGETLPFRSRLASPPAEASGVSVRFFNRRDAQAGFM
jgi:predicted Zn finger-like uncharacterized protein